MADATIRYRFWCKDSGAFWYPEDTLELAWKRYNEHPENYEVSQVPLDESIPVQQTLF
jgi:hypothetical protein